MPTAEFFKLSKRKNSTKQPTGTGTQYTVNLKSGTSFISPTLLLEISSKPDYNYLNFEGMYYFVTDIVSVRQNLWEIYCNVDALATAKTAILNTKAYVIYDSDSNTEIPDNRLPLKTTKAVSSSATPCPFTPDSGVFILSLTGAHGTTGVYAVSSAQLGALIDDLQHIEDNIFDFNNIPQPSLPSKPGSGASIEEWLEYIGDIGEFLGDYIKYAIQCAVRPISQFFGAGNIPENIRECRFIPFNVGVTAPQAPIYLGSFLTQVGSLGKLITDTVHRTSTVTIPWPSGISDFRRRSPYTDIYLYLPYVGMTKLSSENLVGQASIDVSYTLALRNGGLIVTVSSGSQILGQYSGNVGVSVPIGFSNINTPRAAQSIIAAAKEYVTGNVSGFGMAAISLSDSIQPNFSCIGGLDGNAAVAANQNITCYTVFHDTVVAPNTELQTVGSPTMAPKALSGLTGFCQCMDAHVELDKPAVIMDMVDSYLNSGFFIE